MMRIGKYAEWCEDFIVNFQPENICDFVLHYYPGWCEKNCKDLRVECVRKAYKGWTDAEEESDTE